MENITKYYSSFDEWGRLDREPVEFMVNLHYIKKYLPEEGLILDNGAGPGKYSIQLAKSGYKVALADITPKLVEVAKEKVMEYGLEDQITGVHLADARDLHEFASEQFDASLMLGPLYHLQQEEDRAQAVTELRRVTKKDGYVFVAFMSRIRHLTTSLMFPAAWKPNDTVQGINDFLSSGCFNHSDEGRFTGAYYFNIEDIQPFMDSNGFECQKLIASGSIAGGMKTEQWDYWRSRGEQEYDGIVNMILKSAESPYILGSSSHLLYIGKRR